MASAQTAPEYRFRLPAGASTVVRPAHDLLDLEERRFIDQLPVVRVGLNVPDNRPYEVIDANGTVSGIQIELLTHLALALGFRVEPVVLPSFADAVQALRERRVDMMATLGYDREREASMVFTLGTSPNPGAVIGRADGQPWLDNSTLDGKRVAIEQGYVAQAHVRRNWPKAELLETPDTASALRAVAERRADVYVGSLLMAMDRIQREAVPGLEVKKTLVYGTGQMHFAVRKDWPLLASALSKGIAALRAVPLPGMRKALQSLAAQTGGDLPMPMPLSTAEQRILARHSVLKVGAVRGLTLLNEAVPAGGHAGIASDYTQQVVARLGVAATVLPFDSVAQMLDALRAGQLDLAPLLTYTPARSRDFHYSAPYLEMPYHIVARSDAPLYWGLDSLRGKRLALAPQHPLRERLAEQFPDVIVVNAPPGNGAMDMVARGQADASVDVKLFANIRILQDAQGLLRTTSQVDELSAMFHMATGAGAAELVPLLNRALGEISPDERTRILRRWVAIDYDPGFPWQRHLPWLLAAGLGLLLLAAASAWWMRRLSLEVRSRRAAEERLNGLAASLPGVLFQYVRGADDTLVNHYLSPSVAQFLGTTDVARVGLLEAVARRMSRADASALRDARRHSLTERAPFKQTFRCVEPDGRERWLHCEAVVHTLSDGRTAWTGYLVDVSSERVLQTRLLDAMQTKNLFVASASHELRGPLQVITLALRQLGLGALDGRQRELCQIAQDSSTALVALIDDLLDLARLEAGRMVLHPVPVHLPTLLSQVVANHRLVAESRGLRLSLYVAPEAPGHVLLDGLRLRQVLVNLIGNALKYTPQGEVMLEARVAPAEVDQPGDLSEPGAEVPGIDQPPPRPRLLLLVRDTGPGIAPARQDTLFQPFASPGRPDPLDGGTERSTGLGLAICQRLVTAMQGRIRLHSAPGQGTEVTVDLPMPPPAPAAAVAALREEPAPGLQRSGRGTVLLVDDDAVTRLLMGETLRRIGCQVAEAGGGAAAYARWQAGDVRLVISDQQMPGGDGLALLQRIARETPPGQRPRLVLCSGSRLDISADEAGIDAVLRKPVAGERLEQLVEELLPSSVTGEAPG